DVVLDAPVVPHPEQGLTLGRDQLLTQAAVALEGVLDRDLAALAGEGRDAAGEPRSVEVSEPVDGGLGDGVAGGLELVQAIGRGAAAGGRRGRPPRGGVPGVGWSGAGAA